MRSWCLLPPCVSCRSARSVAGVYDGIPVGRAGRCASAHQRRPAGPTRVRDGGYPPAMPPAMTPEFDLHGAVGIRLVDAGPRRRPDHRAAAGAHRVDARPRAGHRHPVRGPDAARGAVAIPRARRGRLHRRCLPGPAGAPEVERSGRHPVGRARHGQARDRRGAWPLGHPAPRAPGQPDRVRERLAAAPRRRLRPRRARRAHDRLGQGRQERDAARLHRPRGGSRRRRMGACRSGGSSDPRAARADAGLGLADPLRRPRRPDPRPRAAPARRDAGRVLGTARRQPAAGDRWQRDRSRRDARAPGRRATAVRAGPTRPPARPRRAARRCGDWTGSSW